MTDKDKMTDFVSLHNQTDFSILDSLVDVKELFLKAKELGQNAVAITDHGSLAATWTAFKISKEVGIKLIVGCEFYFKQDISSDEKYKHIIFLAKNAEGYKNLLSLNKKGFDNGFSLNTGKRVYPIIDWDAINNFKEGLICLTACGNGIISQPLMEGNNNKAEEILLKLKDIFQDNLGVEVQPNNMKRNATYANGEIDQRFLNKKLIDLGRKHNIRIVAACNTHYINKDESEIHDVLLAIGSRQPIYSNFRLKYNVPDFYLKSGDEVKAFFSRNYGEELGKEVCDNTVYFSNLCENPEWVDPKFSNPSGKELPSFPVKDEPDYQEFLKWREENHYDLEEDSVYLRFKCEKELFLYNNKEEYKKRLDKELDTLDYCGVSSYMLVVADYVNWARKNGISVGCGRGSVAGSLVAFLLKIHEADPIKYGLVFERFHNKLKKSYSDIDLDFPQSGRNKVIDYLISKYGKDNVAHVSNINTITSKVYSKDLSRVLELGGSKEEAVKVGNNIADTIPSDPANPTKYKTYESALESSPLFAEYVKKYPEIQKYKKVCGKPRAWATHAGGIIVSNRSLNGLVPLRVDKEGSLALEYDKDDAEENGLVKLDLLGLKNLDEINKTFELIKLAGKEVPVFDYDKYDQKTYDLISSGNTFCIFQFGISQGTIDLCKKIKPKSIEDLAIITALARPGVKAIREDFIKVRNGEAKSKLIHPLLHNAFKNTYGFSLYDESLLILAGDIAGWDLGEADKLRKLTKEKGKNPEKVEKWRLEFIEGSVKNNISEEIAKKIWNDIIINYGKYAFNKSHAVVYSMISYQTAYLKAHFPVEFLLSNLMSEIESNSPTSKDNIAKIKKELRDNKVNITKPHINTSDLSYTLSGPDTLSTGLSAMKYVSEDAINDILEKRPFSSFQDFMSRISSSKVRANTIQALASCGCLDSFDISRKDIFLYCSDYRKKLQIWSKKHDPSKEIYSYPFPKDEWKISEAYALEQFYLGESFVCKPYQAYGDFFKGEHLKVGDIKVSNNKTKLSPVKVIVRDMFEFKVKKETSKYLGQPMVKLVVEDMYGEQISCTIFSDVWKQIQDRIKMINSKIKFEPGIALNMGGSANLFEDQMGFILESLYDIKLAPTLPSDLKAKKMNLKEAKEKDKVKINQSLFDEIEEEMYDEGLIDLDEDDLL